MPNLRDYLQLASGAAGILSQAPGAQPLHLLDRWRNWRRNRGGRPGPSNYPVGAQPQDNSALDLSNWSPTLSDYNPASEPGDYLPMRKGGIVSKPTRVLLGEDGPEMVVPLRNPQGIVSPRLAQVPKLSLPEPLSTVSSELGKHKTVATGHAGLHPREFQLNRYLRRGRK